MLLPAGVAGEGRAVPQLALISSQPMRTVYVGDVPISAAAGDDGDESDWWVRYRLYADCYTHGHRTENIPCDCVLKKHRYDTQDIKDSST